LSSSSSTSTYKPTSLPTTLSLKSISQFLPAIYAFSSFDFIHRTEEEEEEEEEEKL
jgi:hypothetical protein